MRRAQGLVLIILLLATAVLGGCHGGTSSSGVFEVVFTDERLVTASSCAVRGNATNTGNLRARVELSYEAKNASGDVIGTASASFEVSPFSNLEFTTDAFSNGLACAGISSFRRSRTDVTKA